MEQINNNPVSPVNSQSQTGGVPFNQVNNNQADQTSDNTKTIAVVILLCFFYPVGLILMYVWMKWKTWVKVLITVPGCLGLIIFFFSIMLGILATVNPAAQINKGKCAAECKKQAVNQEQCLQSCFDLSTPTLTIPAP